MTIERLDAEQALVAIIDVQGKLTPVMRAADEAVAAIVRLASAARLLGAPIVASEQYPQGLGRTVDALADFVGDHNRAVKTCFSAWRSDAFRALIEAEPRQQTVLCGIEAHVCVLQTALDMSAAGRQVMVAVDACASRRQSDYDAALRRLTAQGVATASVEMILFEWLGDSRHRLFRDFSRLIR